MTNENNLESRPHGFSVISDTDMHDVITKSPEEDALFQAVFDSKWEQAKTLLLHPSNTDLANYKDMMGSTPLHWACSGNAPFEVIRGIYELNPDALLIQEDGGDGDTPLLRACQYASEEILTFLLETQPEAAFITGKDKSYPLHRLILWKRSPSIIQKVLQINPEAVNAEDSYSETPMQELFEAWKCDLGNCIHRLQDLRNGRDANGRFTVTGTLLYLVKTRVYGSIDDVQTTTLGPVHAALSLEEVPALFKILLIQTFPNHAMIADADGNLPLHIAASQKVNSVIIELLLNVYPQATEHRNNDGLTPLNLAKRAGGTADNLVLLAKASNISLRVVMRTRSRAYLSFA